MPSHDKVSEYMLSSAAARLAESCSHDRIEILNQTLTRTRSFRVGDSDWVNHVVSMMYI
jgi:hypothetical protein